jgi:C-terminal peptidase prc
MPFMTKPKFWGVLAAFLLYGLAAVPARAADDEVAQPYIVIVGIDHYADPQILPRKHAEADARALYDIFLNKDYLGVEARHVKLLLGSEDAKRNAQPATRANILAALQWLTENATRNDLVVFAFFGQGAPLGERAVLLGKDSTFKNRAKDAVATSEFVAALDKLKSQRFVSFIDAHFTGFNLGKEPPPDPNIGKFYSDLVGKDDDKGGLPSRAFFFANSGVKPSIDLKGHGVFAQAVIDGLHGTADADGYEADGLITVGELAKYVRKAVPDLLRAAGKNDDFKGHHPVILEGQATDFAVDLNPKVTAQTAKRLAAFEKLAKGGGLAKNLVEEGTHLLRRMPKLEAQQNLRKAYQKVADGQLALNVFQTERDKILAGTRLTEVEATLYARMVLRATDVVQEKFYKPTNPGQMVEWALRGLYKRVEERMPSSIEQRVEGARRLPRADLLKLLTEARLHLGKREDLAGGADVTYSLQSMTNKLDKHTDYADPDTVKRDKHHYTGDYTGIGVQIRKNDSKDMLQVVTPMHGSPAHKAGMYAGDIITSIVREVDEEGNRLPAPETFSTKGMETSDAVKKILGKAGTAVKLIVHREGVAKPLEFNLIRAKVEVESVLGHKRNDDDSWNYVVDPENKICYVRLNGFTGSTARDLEKVMRDLSKVGIKGFILDLRYNPGGLLTQAVKVTDLFIDDGMIVTIKPRNEPEVTYIGKSDGSLLAFPMVCLINGYSASGSEIVAAALQDHGRAVVIGSRSYGKGSVQTMLDFETEGQLKVTTATFWRPSGRNLNKADTRGREEDEWGVLPDQGFNLTLPYKEFMDLQDHQRDQEIIHRPDRRNLNGRNGFRDRQMDMALEYLRNQIRTSEGGAAAAAKKAG